MQKLIVALKAMKHNYNLLFISHWTIAIYYGNGFHFLVHFIDVSNTGESLT